MGGKSQCHDIESSSIAVGSIAACETTKVTGSLDDAGRPELPDLMCGRLACFEKDGFYDCRVYR